MVKICVAMTLNAIGNIFWSSNHQRGNHNWLRIPRGLEFVLLNLTESQLSIC